jgi:hypothetical protein
MDYLAEIKRIAPRSLKPVGCNEQEVVDLEAKIGYALPEAYRQYLLWMGNDHTGILGGSNWFLRDVIENTEYVPELLAENSVDFALPEHYLAFFGHQGYMTAWFILPKESENPMCYFYGEGQKHKGQPITKPIIEGTFTEFLFIEIKGMI